MFFYPIDLSLLYNPFLYSNPLFWPPLLFPYQQQSHAALQSPQSPSHNRDYTLTPEKDDHIIGKLTFKIFLDLLSKNLICTPCYSSYLCILFDLNFIILN